MLKKIIALLIMLTAYNMQAMKDVSLTSTLNTLVTSTQQLLVTNTNQLVVTGTMQLVATGTPQTMVTGTDLLSTNTQYNYIQTIFTDLAAVKDALAADKQLFQDWNNAIAALNSSLETYQEQQTAALDQVTAMVTQLQQTVAQQDQQSQNYLMTINELSEQLGSLQKQTDQEILALQKQLDETNVELELLEDEYGEFIDASFAHTQAFYSMLQLAKQEYSTLLSERTQFFNALQLLSNTVQNLGQSGSEQVYKLVANLQSIS